MANLNTALPYIKKAEGGLSRATTDTASAHPAPWPHNGKTGWHTNKGITFMTFSSNAPKLGYSVTPDNFFLMPDSIWVKIYKSGYWDPMKAGLINSEAIAVAVVDYAWAFGVGGATTRLKKWLSVYHKVLANGTLDIANAINKLVLSKGENVIFEDLIRHRKAAFLALNQPANEKGWMARMDELKNYGQNLVGKFADAANKNKGSGIVFTAAAILLIWKRKAIAENLKKFFAK